MKYFCSLLFIFLAFKLIATDSTVVDSVMNIQLNRFEMPQEVFSEGNEVYRVSKLQDFSYYNSLNKYWWYLLIISIVLIVFYVTNNQYSFSLIKSLSSLHTAQKLARSPNNIGVLSAYIYIFLFCAILAITLKHIVAYFFDEYILTYLYFIVFFAFFIIEIVLIEATGFILNKKQLAQKIRFNNTSVLFGSLIILLPLAYFILFSQVFVQLFAIYLFLFILGVILIFREYRTYRFIFLEKKSIGFFHFFLYICTFKITPFILLVKVLINIV